MTRRRTAAFAGTMNAMPMAYALELRARGWDVTCLVDVPQSDTLSRPEYKFKSVPYPYPAWIMERPVRSQLLPALAPTWLLRDILQMLRTADVVFLSGMYLSLARLLRREQRKVFLSYGADLDVWCDVEHADRHAALFEKRTGRFVARRLVRHVIRRMAASLRDVDLVVAFPPGTSAAADRVLARELAGTAVRRLSRYDISFIDLPSPDRIRAAAPGPVLKIICGTRHTFRPHPGLMETENKRTDIMIRGIAQYLREPGAVAVEVHLFEKGLDLAEAKALCEELGLAPVVTWHAQMAFTDYIELHQQCHLAFDQLGPHWIGTGMYAMYLGLPVIGNGQTAIHQLRPDETSPLCHARSEPEVVDWLRRLADPQCRAEIGRRSQQFAVDHFGCDSTLDRILEQIDGSQPSTVAPARPVVAEIH